MHKITTLAEVHETLTHLGYESTLKSHAVAVKVGGQAHPFPAVITHNANTNHFQITCLVAKMGEVPEKQLAALALAALDANSRIVPFAYALLTESANPQADDENEWPLVLMDSLPIGDLSPEELSSSMRSLLAALLDSRNVLEALTAKV